MLTIGVIDCGSSKVQRLTSILEANDCRVCTIPLAEANGYDVARLDGLVISGGPHLFTDRRTGKVLVQQFKIPRYVGNSGPGDLSRTPGVCGTTWIWRISRR